MSDLREQITEVIKRVDCLPSGETDPYEDMADAVIRELGPVKRADSVCQKCGYGLELIGGVWCHTDRAAYLNPHYAQPTPS